MSTIGGSTSFAGLPDSTSQNKTKKKRTKKKKTGGSNGNSTSAKALKKKVDAYVSSEEEDYSDDEEEGKKGYRPGGYHPVQVGDVFKGRYLTLEKMGWGHFSTVWLCRDSSNNKLVALKIVKSAKHYSSAALDEIKILKAITANDPEGKVKVLHLIDSFDHKGPNGKHVCMVFQLLGSNLLELIKRYNYRGIPIRIVKHIIYDVLTALDFLHTKCQVIHTDLKPENVLLENVLPKIHRLKREKGVEKSEANLSEESEEERDDSVEGEKKPRSKENSTEKNFKDLSLKSEDEKEGVKNNKIAEGKEEVHKDNHEDRRSHETKENDLPNKTRESMDVLPPKPNSSFLTPVEVVESDPSTYSAYLVDLGNACWVREHFTDEVQTRQYRAPEVIIGAKYSASVDMWSVACLTFELLTGDLLFEPQDGSNYDKDDDHLAQMIEVLGPIPKKFALSGKNSKLHFTSSGELRFIKKLTMWGLKEVLEQKYHFTPEQSPDMTSFLTSMMDFIPENRVTAAQALKHKWLAEVVEWRENATLSAISSSLMESSNSMSSVEESVLAFSTDMKVDT